VKKVREDEKCIQKYRRQILIRSDCLLDLGLDGRRVLNRTKENRVSKRGLNANG
jgi:hypothetical protein